MRKNAAPAKETVLSRSTMSHAFEAALRPYMTAPLDQVPTLAVDVAKAIPNGFRKRPTWRVSKRPQRRK